MLTLPVHGHLVTHSFDHEAVWQGFGEEEEDCDEGDDGDDSALDDTTVDAQHTLPSSPLQPLDDGPEHIAY